MTIRHYYVEMVIINLCIVQRDASFTPLPGAVTAILRAAFRRVWEGVDFHVVGIVSNKVSPKHIQLIRKLSKATKELIVGTVNKNPFFPQPRQRI